MDSSIANNSYPAREYIAFISYRQKEFDTAVSKKLHALIERFRIPKAYRKNGAAKFGVAFRDIEELSASEDLSAAIYDALDHSQYLIVICTPDTPHSKWVEREINYFLKTHDRSHVLAVLAAGTPEASFPPSLIGIDKENNTTVLPAAANICAETTSQSIKKIRKESLRLFSKMLDCPYDSLVQRNQKRRHKRISVAILTAFLILFGYIGILANSNHQIENKNTELGLMNVSLTKQKQELQLSESTSLTQEAESALVHNNRIQSIKNSIAALPHEGNDRPYYPPAEKILVSALGVFDKDNSIISNAETSINLSSSAKNIIPIENENSIIVLGDDNNISSYNIHTGALIWQVSLNSYKVPLTSSCTVQISFDQTNNYIYALYNCEIFAFSPKNGSFIWQTNSQHRFIRFLKNKSNNTIVAFQKNNTNIDSVYSFEIVILNATSGKETGRCSINKEFNYGSLYANEWISKIEENNFCFSNDGTQLFGVIYDHRKEQSSLSIDNESIIEGNSSKLSSEYNYLDNTQYANYFSLDLKSAEIKIMYSEPSQFHGILWMGIQETNDEQILTVIQTTNLHRQLQTKTINLTAGQLIYSAKPNPIIEKGDTYYTVLHFKEDLLLASAANQLFLIQISTGKIIDQRVMSDSVLCLFDIGMDHIGYVLADGTYETDLITSIGFNSHDFEPEISYSLRSASMACPGGGGYIKPTSPYNNSQLLTGGYSEGYGYIATIDSSNKRNLTINHLIIYDACFEDIKSKLDSPSFYFQNGDFINFYSDGTMLYNDGQKLYYFNPEIHESPIEYYDPNHRIMDIYWLGTENSIIMHTDMDEYIRHDFTDGTDTSFAKDNLTILGTTKEGDYSSLLVDYISKSKSVQFPANDSVLTAQCNGKNLTTWRNGIPDQSIDLPEYLSWNYIDNYGIHSLFDLGENECILLSNYSAEADNNSIQSFVLYNLKNNTWSQIEDCNHGTNERKTTVGTYNEIFAIYDPDMIIRIYNPQNNTVNEIKTNISPDTIVGFKFIYDDNFIAICTQDGMFEIYNINNTELTYSNSLNIELSDPFTVHTDNQNHRAYFIFGDVGDHTCLCLETSSWCELGKIKKVYGYDSINDRIFFYDYQKGVYYRHIPTLEELIHFGKSIIQEN